MAGIHDDEVSFVGGFLNVVQKTISLYKGISYSWGFNYKLAATRASSFIGTSIPLCYTRYP